MVSTSKQHNKGEALQQLKLQPHDDTKNSLVAEFRSED